MVFAVLGFEVFLTSKTILNLSIRDPVGGPCCIRDELSWVVNGCGYDSHGRLHCFCDLTGSKWRQRERLKAGISGVTCDGARWLSFVTVFQRSCQLAIVRTNQYISKLVYLTERGCCTTALVHDIFIAIMSCYE